MNRTRIVMRVTITAALIAAALAWGLSADIRAQSAALVQSIAAGKDAEPAPLASRMLGTMAIASLPDITSAVAQIQSSDPKADALARMMRRMTMAQRKAAADRAAVARAELAKRTGKTSTSPTVKGATVATSQAVYVADPTGTFVVPDYFGTDPNWAQTPPLRKFVNHLPGLGAGAANELGQYIPVATPILVGGLEPFPGSDYYEIEVSDYTARMHSDLGPTQLRGYKDLNPAGDGTHQYLGPVIVATKDKPVRVKFFNRVATGAAGNLFIPSDSTVMGAGMGDGGSYSDNRATLHLHGGLTPWISDGTPHQWTTPIGESTSFTPFLKGVSTQAVPDMPAPGPGELTFYWPNQQSSRLMFYHDHAYGITRTNVYAGEASGYVLTDAKEQDLITRGILPDIGTPLVIQDKTFVAGADPLPAIPAGEVPYVSGFPRLATPLGRLTVDTDPTWNPALWTGAGLTAPIWGQTTGSLWYPHVYNPNQNPYDMSGANGMGRWDYGPWFWPPMPVGPARGAIKNGPILNPYNNGLNPPATTDAPGIPNPTLTPESFMDTPIVNGTAYPVLNVNRQAYRFRVLSVGNDRMLNLNLVYAFDPGPDGVMGPNPLTGVVDDIKCVAGAGDRCTEVAMLPAVPHAKTGWATTWDGLRDCSNPLVVPVLDPVSGVPNNCWPTSWPWDGRDGGAPDPRHFGPPIVQIGTEGGFLPAPVTITGQPVTYVMDKRNIVVLNVDQKALFLGPAERADILIDFSQIPAGSKLILYNDAPAPVPASDPRLDYYTGNVDYTATGGAPSTLPGYGPNTRTIMRFDVGATTGLPISTSLAAEISAAFGTASDPIPIPEPDYITAYTGTQYAGAYPLVYSTIQANTLTFTPLPDLITPAPAPLINFPMQPKAIQELFETEYGRMNATLGVELPFTNGTNQTTIPMGYPEIPTEVLNDSVFVGPVRLGDGTQIWKITHNGVDSHVIHVHLFNAQVLNRVGWDGAVRMPDANELGWKESIRMNPLEDCIIAMRAVAPALPFGVPVSVRNYDITKPPSAQIETFDFRDGTAITVPNDPAVAVLDPNLNPNLPGLNTLLPENFGWEYVWHCHILGHEENDMMRPVILNVAVQPPLSPDPVTYTPGAGNLSITWTDQTPVVNPLAPANLGNPANEIGFRVEQFILPSGPWTVRATAAANTTGPVVDPTPGPTTDYQYRVVAFNAAGDTASLPFSVFASPQTPTSFALAVVQVGGQPRIQLTWVNGLTTLQTGVEVWRSTNGGAFSRITTTGPTATLYTDTGSLAATQYAYYLRSVRGNVVPVLYSAPTPTLNGSTTPILSTVTPNVATPMLANGTNSVTWTAAPATGGIPPIQYQFWRYNVGTATYTLVQNWGISNTYSWTPAAGQAGTWLIRVYARNNGAGAYQAVAYSPYFVTTSSTPVVNSITAAPPSPMVGNGVNTVTWTANVTGGLPPLSYQFWLRNNGTGIYTLLQNWGASNQASWTPPLGSAGTYLVRVYVRNNGTTTGYDAVGYSAWYTIQ